MKNTKWMRLLSLVLVLATLFQMVPLPVSGSENARNTSYGINDTPAVTVVGEMEELREEDTKHFRMSDGSYIAVTYGIPVHYQDENNKWQDIDNRLTSKTVDNDAAIYQSGNAKMSIAFKSDLADGDIFTVEKENMSVTLALLDTAQAVQLTTGKTDTNDDGTDYELLDDISEEQADRDMNPAVDSVTEEAEGVIDIVDNLAGIEHSVEHNTFEDTTDSQTESEEGMIETLVETSLPEDSDETETVDTIYATDTADHFEKGLSVAEPESENDSITESVTEEAISGESSETAPTECVEETMPEEIINETISSEFIQETLPSETETVQNTEETTAIMPGEQLIGYESVNAVAYSRTAIAEVEVSTQNPFRVEEQNWKVEDLIPDNLQSSLLYEDVFSGIDIRYIAIGNNIKEQIIVKEPQKSYRYDFLLELKGLTSVQNADGSITLHNAEGKKVYEIPCPYMEDSANNISYEAYYTLTDTDQGTVLTVTADADWINDSNRVFPVMIDPSLIAVSGSVQNQMYSCYVKEGDNSQVQDSSVNIFSGVSSDNKRYRTFLHFSQTPVIPTGYEVVSAELALYKRFYQHENQGELAFGVYEVTTEKPSEYSTYADWLSAMTWATKPAYDTNNLLDYVRISSDAHQYLTWDMTELVQKWYETDIQNKTVAITAISEDEQIEAAEYGYACFASSTNAGNGTPPILIVSYRSTMGIEPYYTYATLDTGNAGTGYVADNSGQLKVVREVASYASGVNPFSLNLVYNSDHFSRSSDDYQHAQEMGLNVKLGSGWTLDVIQTIDEAEITGNSYLRYHDGDGTYHYFLKNETDGLYYDEDGLGLKIKNLGSNQFEMTDDKDNLWCFDNGFLKEIMDNNRTKSADGTLSNDGNLIRINYNADNTLRNVQQINRNGAVITVASFAYNSSGYLERITDAAGKVTTLGYTGTDMTSITRDSYVVGEYTYSGHRITQLKDTQRSYAVEIGYTSDNRVASYRETGNGANGAGAEIQYPDRGKTVYHDYGTDGTAGTDDDVYTTCLFDHAMRTVNMYSTETAVTQSDTLMSDVISASNAVYNNAGSADSETGDISKAYKKNNRIARSSSIGVASQQLMQNFGFESGTNGWTLGGVSSEGKNTNIVVKVDNPRTGNYSLKGYIKKNNTYTTGVSASRATGILTAGTTYTLSAYVNTSRITQLKGTGLYLLVNDHKGNTWQSNCINYTSSTIIDDGWVRLSVTFTAKNSVSHTIGLFNDRAEGVFFADDFQLEKADGPSNVNLLENGSMTTANSGWTILDGGSFTGGGILLTGDPDNGNTKFYQDVPLNLPGTETYVVSGWAKGNAVPDNVVTGDPETDKEAYAKDAQKQFGLRAVVYYTDGSSEFHYAPFDPDVTGWQFTSFAVVPKQPEKTVEKIRITGTYERNGNTARFDNFSLVREVAQTLDYDEDGNLESVATSGIEQDVNTYSGGNLISTVTGGNGTYNYDYDETFTRRLTKTTVTGTGINQSYTYDTDGNVTATTLAGSGSKTLNTSASYTNSGNLLSTVTDSSGNTTSYAYGTELSKTFGVPSSITDAKGTTMTQTVDTFGRITNSSVANLNQIYYTYSSFRPYQIIRKNGSNVSQTYQFGYDDYGNVARVKVGSKTLAQYAYGANNGPLSTLTYGNGDTVNYTYDRYGRLKQEIQDDGSTMTYTYNGEGMLYSAAESGAGRNIRTVYTYDTLDRLIYKDFVKGTTSSLRYSAGYNNKNQLVTRGWATNGLNYQENFTYNSADGTLNTMTIDTDATTGVEHTFQLYYDGLRRLLTENRGAYSFSYTYKDLSDTQTTNQIQSLSYSGAAGNIGFHYTYDALGNIVTYQEPSGTFTYTYDAQGQLTKAVKGSTTYNYSYDSVGNILTANGHTYTYGNSDWKDLLTAYDGKSITYDGSGNPTSYYNGTRWTFGWTNGRNLTSASNGTTSATYTYNLDGSRASKTVDGVPHYYLWQDGKPIKEYVDGNSDIFDRYDTLYFLYDENGRPFALIFNGTTYYYVLNLQGDVMRLVDASGNIVAEYTYDPYGNILTATGDLAQVNPLRYRGYYYDAETGLYYVSSRYYDPQIGRFINADDINYLGADNSALSYNLFTYCVNNPVNRFDANGNFSLPNSAKIAIGATAIAIGVIATAFVGGAVAPVLVASLKISMGSAVLGGVSGAGISAVSHRVSTGNWEGIGKAAISGAIDGACDGFMWGGITAGASFTTVAAKGVKIQEIGKLKPSNKSGDGYPGVKYQAPKANGKYTTRSIELHSPHESGPHNVWHWQQNTWSEYNGVSRITSSAKHWRIWGKRI